MTTRTAPVTVGDAPLTIDDVNAVAEGAQVVLSAQALERIRRSRDVIDQKLAADEPTYGLNRGLGHNKDQRISADEATMFSLTMLRAHEGGIGEPLPRATVRAAMLARVCGIAQGGAGASPAMPETLVAMINAGVTPDAPSIGSIGAGDLGVMASIGLVAIGEGYAEFGGERSSGGDALQRAGIAPLSLGPKDGLTIMSANAISIGHGALVTGRVRRAADLADTAAALSLEAMGANISIIDPAVGEAKPFAGQIESAANIRTLLDGSYLESKASTSVQEALSFRVIPQVHGTLRDVLTFAITTVETELNAAADNPLVSPDGRMIHNGNFEPLLLAVAFDALRIALAHVGQLSDRRMSHLWNAIFKSPGMRASPRPLHGVSLRYPAAACFTELDQLAAPATLDVPILDVGVEDHASGAPLSVSKTAAAVERLVDVLTIEILLIRDLLNVGSATPKMAHRTGAVLRDVDSVIDALAPGARADAVHAAVRGTLATR